MERRARRLVAGLAVVLAVLLSAAEAAAAPPLKATLTARSHAPAVGAAWKWTVTATRGGAPVAATVKLQILFGTAVVGCWKAGQMAECTKGTGGQAIGFKGSRAGVIRWPAESSGVPLTFRAIVSAGGKTVKLTYPLTVKRKTP